MRGEIQKKRILNNAVFRSLLGFMFPSEYVTWCISASGTEARVMARALKHGGRRKCAIAMAAHKRRNGEICYAWREPYNSMRTYPL